MTKLRKNFSKIDWKDCCGKFCKNCKIAIAYKEKYGKNGPKKLKKDRKKIKK